jgi:hypothetical protein
MNETKFLITRKSPDDYYELRRTRVEDIIKSDHARVRVHASYADGIWPAFKQAFEQSGLPTDELKMNMHKLGQDTWFALENAPGARLALTMQFSNSTTNQTKLNEIMRIINDLTDEDAISTYEHYFQGKTTNESRDALRRLANKIAEVQA